MAKLYIHNLCVLAVWLCFTFAVSHAQGNALHFTSGPDRVHIPNPIAGHTEYTFEAWFRSDNTSTASNHIARIANLGTTYKRFEIGDTDGDLMIYDGGYRRILGSNIRDGQYHHVAISKKNDTYRVYLDGVLVRTQTDAHHLRSTLVIGSFNSSNASNSQWKGMIDDIRLWDHERSLPEIQQNMSCGLSGTEAGLVGYWNCDEGLPGGNNQGINHLEDQSSTNSHGNLVSFSQNGGSSNFLLSDALLESNCQMTGELIISTHLDADCNGERDGGDTYLPGITYDILNADGTLYQTLTGNNQGMVILTDLPFGTYQIVAVLQNGYTFSNPVDGELLAILSTENTYIQSEFLFCNSSDNAANEDGLVINAFRDLDCDGVFDPGEPPYEGLRFRINPEPCPFGQDNLTVITDQDGQIVLENLPPGDYLIYPRFFPQGVYVTTPLNSYGAANIDFDNSLFEINFGICETGLCDVADNTLLLNTGLDENGDLYPEPPFVSTQIDPFWRLINEPPSFDGDDMATGYTVPNLFVIEPRPGAPGWNIIEGTWPLNVLGNSNFGFDNQDPQQPWLFQRQFCLSQDDTVCIDGNIRSDNFGELYLIGPDGNLIMVGNTTEGYLARTGPDGPICEVDSNTGRNFIRDWPIRAANRLFLEAGTYNLQFELANISAVAMGFAAEISITPFSESTTITNPDAFCGTGSLSIQKNIDTNCDSILNEGEPPGIGIEFLIESDQLDQPITAITNEFGEISLSGLSYGIYTITEVFRPGWVVTSPPGGSITVDISFEDPVAFVNFLNCERTCPELILQLDSCACCPVFDLVTVEDAAFNTVSLFINDTETIDMSSVVLADGFELSPASSGSELIIQRSDGIAIETSIERLIAYCYEDEGDESQSLEISFQDGNGVDLDCTSELQTNCTASDPCLPQLPCGFSMTYICGECSCGGDVATVTIRDAFGAPVDEDIVTITWYVDDVLTIPGAGNQNYLIPSYNGPLVVTAEVEYTQSDSTVCDTTISREILCLGDCPTVNFATCEDAAFSETQQCVDEGDPDCSKGGFEGFVWVVDAAGNPVDAYIDWLLDGTANQNPTYVSFANSFEDCANVPVRVFNLLGTCDELHTFSYDCCAESAPRAFCYNTIPSIGTEITWTSVCDASEFQISILNLTTWQNLDTIVQTDPFDNRAIIPARYQTDGAFITIRSICRSGVIGPPSNCVHISKYGCQALDNPCFGTGQLTEHIDENRYELSSVGRELSLYPNPVFGHWLNIDFPLAVSDNTGYSSLKVVNAFGQVLLDRPISLEYKLRLDVSRWPTGTYMLMGFDNSGGLIDRESFIIQRP